MLSQLTYEQKSHPQFNRHCFSLTSKNSSFIISIEINFIKLLIFENHYWYVQLTVVFLFCTVFPLFTWCFYSQFHSYSQSVNSKSSNMVQCSVVTSWTDKNPVDFLSVITMNSAIEYIIYKYSSSCRSLAGLAPATLLQQLVITIYSHIRLLWHHIPILAATASQSCTIHTVLSTNVFLSETISQPLHSVISVV
jgi:hypothetical protein